MMIAFLRRIFTPDAPELDHLAFEDHPLGDWRVQKLPEAQLRHTKAFKCAAVFLAREVYVRGTIVTAKADETPRHNASVIAISHWRKS